MPREAPHITPFPSIMLNRLVLAWYNVLRPNFPAKLHVEIDGRSALDSVLPWLPMSDKEKSA
jgi:hypothetical protein